MEATQHPDCSTKQLKIVCRGCSMYDRECRWHSFVSSASMNDDNSYLTFEEEPQNKYDPNAVRVLSRGEIFGTVGYVGREFALEVKKLLNECSYYRIDMADTEDAGKKGHSTHCNMANKKQC